MGYGYYTLPDGREAGYNVTAFCDALGCTELIDRGLAYLCGFAPDGHRDDFAWGCGRYFCHQRGHYSSHDCPNTQCGFYYWKDGEETWLKCELGTQGEHPFACEDHRDLYDQSLIDYATNCP